ncbi:MAG: alcohol dehydrogenase catalytic domain-containing protein [Anaerolineaceae bacterium]|jgi:L-iditol 2-dehydrogenase
MKAAVFTAPGMIEYNPNYPDPTVGDGIILQVKAGGICGTDIKALAGHRPGMNPPMILGHEFSGQVIESHMDEYKIGDRISVAPYAGCGICDLCLNDREELCKNKFGTPSGCFSEKIAIPASLAKKTAWHVPDGVGWDEAALAEPLACVVLSLRSCHLEPGNSILVVGGGFMGLLHVVLAKAWGANKILLSEPNPTRRKVAEALGATTIDPTANPDMCKWSSDMTNGRGPNIVVTPVGIPEVVESAIDCAAQGGYVHMFGGLPKDKKISVSAYTIHYKEVSLIGTSGFRTKDYRLAADMIANRKVVLTDLISKRYSLENAKEAFNSAQDQNNLKIIINP